jgi:hypothetical protein
MKKHTNSFKEQIKEMGRELDSLITFGDTVLGNEDLNAVTPSFQSSILKSAMKQLEIDSNAEIPIGTILNYKFGLRVNGEYEYLDFGNYVVHSSEKQEDTLSYKITCYDKMLFTMKEYKSLENGSFPMTIRDYLTNLCLDCGLLFIDTNKEFVNYDKVIQNDVYANLGYTYRDILDELSQVTASIICLNKNDSVQIRYQNDTQDTVDEEYFNDINVNFGEKYGNINSVVLSRSGESDNIYLQDAENIEANGLKEIKIIDNQIMNFNDRADYLPQILEKLKELEYYINDFSSTGICYYDIYDKYYVQIGENTYPCIMFNNEVLVTQGLEENVYTELPKESETDYTKATQDDRILRKTNLIVDKQNQTIQATISSLNGLNDELTNLDKTVEKIKENQTSVTGQITQMQQSLTAFDFRVVNIENNGVTKVQNTLVTIDVDGIKVATNESAISTLITNNSFVIKNYDEMLAQFNNDGAVLDNLTVRKYLTAGAHRREKFQDEETGEWRTGEFYVGGDI